MILSTYIDGSIGGDYVLAKGVFEQNTEIITEAYTRIVTPINTYVFDTSFGSLIPTWIDTRKTVTAQLLINEVKRALATLISTKRVKSIDIKVNSIILTGFMITLSIIDNDEKKWVLPLNFLNYNNIGNSNNA